MSKFLFVADVLRRGGGPSGYLWNLREALDTLGSKSDIHFWSAQDERDGGLTNPLDKSGIYKRLVSKVRRGSSVPAGLRTAVDASEIVVFHGYQNKRRIRYASRRGKVCIYMPHSPSVMADEIKMLRHHAGKRIAYAEWRFYFNMEKSLVGLSDFVVFPSPNSHNSYEVFI